MNDMQVNFPESSNSTETNRMNLFQRLIGMIVSPGAVMENLAERPRVLFGILASFLVMPLFYLSRLQLFIGELRETQLKTIPMYKEKYGVEMTAEMVEKQLPFTTVTGIAGVAFVGILMLFFFTLVFFAICKIFGGQGKFKAYLSVTGYAYVVTILYFIVTFIASFFTGSLHQTTPLTSLANLFPAGTQGTFLFGVVNGIDLFNIWYYVVLAIGLTKVSKLKKPLVYGAVCVVYVIGLLIGGAGAGIAGALM